ncbi:MAG: ATP-grasp domain-containing protein [Aggregatilineales bacterium]
MTHTIMCITSYFKGNEFMVQAKKEGCHVILLTEEKIKDANWANEYIDQTFLMPDLSKLPDVIYAVSYLAREKKIDLIIPLDEYDVEMAAILREHLRIAGMGMSQTKIFRDKLSMRIATRDAGISVPPFSKVINYDELREYINSVPPPYVLKPRLEAGAMGIKKIHNHDELWYWINELGDQQSFRVLEQYIPGAVYHVDSIIDGDKVIFASVQKYGQPPMNVAHDGGVFITQTLAANDPDSKKLLPLNKKVIKALGLKHGVTHAEFIKGHADGEYYFLEIAARVGGAHISDLVEAATNVNLWAEWARLEIAHLRGETYQLPVLKNLYAGLLVSLAKQEYPDMSGYNDPEVVWRINKKQHAGVIVASDKKERIDELMESYQHRFVDDFLAIAPPLDKPND